MWPGRRDIFCADRTGPADPGGRRIGCDCRDHGRLSSVVSTCEDCILAASPQYFVAILDHHPDFLEGQNLGIFPHPVLDLWHSSMDLSRDLGLAEFPWCLQRLRIQHRLYHPPRWICRWPAVDGGRADGRNSQAARGVKPPAGSTECFRQRFIGDSTEERRRSSAACPAADRTRKDNLQSMDDIRQKRQLCFKPLKPSSPARSGISRPTLRLEGTIAICPSAHATDFRLRRKPPILHHQGPQTSPPPHDGLANNA